MADHLEREKPTNNNTSNIYKHIINNISSNFSKKKKKKPPKARNFRAASRIEQDAYVIFVNKRAVYTLFFEQDEQQRPHFCEHWSGQPNSSL